MNTSRPDTTNDAAIAASLAAEEMNQAQPQEQQQPAPQPQNNEAAISQLKTKVQWVSRMVRGTSCMLKLCGGIGALIATYLWFSSGRIANQIVEGVKQQPFPPQHGMPEDDIRKPVSRDEFDLYDGLKTFSCLLAMLSFILMAIGKMGGWAAFKKNSGTTFRVRRMTRCSFCMLIILTIITARHLCGISHIAIKHHRQNQEIEAQQYLDLMEAMQNDEQFDYRGHNGRDLQSEDVTRDFAEDFITNFFEIGKPSVQDTKKCQAIKSADSCYADGACSWCSTRDEKAKGACFSTADAKQMSGLAHYCESKSIMDILFDKLMEHPYSPAQAAPKYLPKKAAVKEEPKRCHALKTANSCSMDKACSWCGLKSEMTVGECMTIEEAEEQSTYVYTCKGLSKFHDMMDYMTGDKIVTEEKKSKTHHKKQHGGHHRGGEKKAHYGKERNHKFAMSRINMMGRMVECLVIFIFISIPMAIFGMLCMHCVMLCILWHKCVKLEKLQGTYKPSWGGMCGWRGRCGMRRGGCRPCKPQMSQPVAPVPPPMTAVNDSVDLESKTSISMVSDEPMVSAPAPCEDKQGADHITISIPVTGQNANVNGMI